MKNIISILGLILMTLTLVSCQKEDANKDVELAIAKLNNFNIEFTTMYKDGIISKDTILEEDDSEYDRLEKMANEYYAMVNKMNSNVDDEAEKIEEGKKPKKLEGYTEAYETAKIAHKDEIDAALKTFEANIMLVDPKTVEDEVEIEDVDIIELDSTEMEEVIDPSV